MHLLVLPVVIGVVVIILAGVALKYFSGNKKGTQDVTDALRAIQSIFGDKFGGRAGILFTFFLNAFERVISQNLTEQEALTELVNLITVAAPLANITLTPGEISVITNIAQLFFDRIGIKFFSPVQTQTVQLQAAIDSVRKI